MIEFNKLMEDLPQEIRLDGLEAARYFAFQEPIPGALLAYGLSENISNRIEENQVEVFVEKEIIITKEVVNPISYIILGFSIVLIIISGLIFRKAKN